MDVSTTGVGAVLSWQYGEPPRLQPCAYYSRKLTPVEQNYDMGNKELLAIKLAQEWRHWLEGANHPFTVITDHKNLQYLREAKGSTHDKPAGPCSLPGLTSPLPTVLEAVSPRRTLFKSMFISVLFLLLWLNFFFFFFYSLFLLFFYVYLTSFYVKHFELPLCMKCAI